MNISEAYKILGLKEGAKQEDILNAYKQLIKDYHPDINPDSNFSYELNEAKKTLLQNFEPESSKEIMLYVAKALSESKEQEKKEKELNKEIDLLITSNTKSKRDRIEKYRNYSLIGSFLIAIFTFLSSTNASLFSLYETAGNNDEMYRLAEKLFPLAPQKINDSTIVHRTHNQNTIDSLYMVNSNFREAIKVRSELNKSQNSSTPMIKTILSIYLALGIFAAAYFQFRVKQYENYLNEFKKIIDVKSKLKRLLYSLTKNLQVDKKVEESQLLESIEFIINSKGTNIQDDQLNYSLELVKKLSINDAGRIILLKFLEKDLIQEIRVADQHPLSVWYTLDTV